MHILYGPRSKRRHGIYHRVKLRDLGEFERGTTGDVAQKIQLGEGPGNRLDFPIAQLLTLHPKHNIYTLHTGALPSDDEEEIVMHEKTLQGVFEDPDVAVYQ